MTGRLQEGVFVGLQQPSAERLLPPLQSSCISPLEGGEDLKGEIWEMIEGAARQAMDECVPEGQPRRSGTSRGSGGGSSWTSFVVVSELPETNDADNEFERDDIEKWVVEGLRGAFHRKPESLGAPQPIPCAQSQRLQYSGRGDAPGAQLARAAQMRPPLKRQEAPEPAQPEQVDEFGMAKSARSDIGRGAGVVPGLSSGPDPRTLVANRGEDAGLKKPVHVTAEPGRDDPCPCGSGKKYKKCHGK